MPKKTNNSETKIFEIPSQLWQDYFLRHISTPMCKLAKKNLKFSTEFNDDKTVTNVWLSMSISERKVEEEKGIRQAWKENYGCP